MSADCEGTASIDFGVTRKLREQADLKIRVPRVMKFECGLKYSCRLALEGSVPESETEGSEVTQSCPTRCDPMDCSPPGSSIHGILQAKILEWVVISFPGIFLTKGLNSHLLHLLHWRQILYHLGSPPLFLSKTNFLTDKMRYFKANKPQYY